MSKSGVSCDDNDDGMDTVDGAFGVGNSGLRSDKSCTERETTLVMGVKRKDVP